MSMENNVATSNIPIRRFVLRAIVITKEPSDACAVL